MTVKRDANGQWYNVEAMEKKKETARFNEFEVNANLMEFANQFIKQVGDNVYELTTPKDFNYLDGPFSFYKNLHKKVIKRKSEIGSTDVELDIDDLYMVHSMYRFPKDFCYSSHSRLGTYVTVPNPFFSGSFLGNDDEFKIVMPSYRDTVHFALNGLVSNTGRTSNFTNRNFVVIEPLSDHFDKLLNLNPVDTIMDVKDSDESIGKNAVFIMEKTYYEGLTDKIRKELEKYKVFIFDYKKLFSNIGNRYENSSPLQVVTDFVLCSMGILPQHSVNQSVLHSEDYKDGIYHPDEERPDIIFDRVISDSEYLKKFNDLIERLNVERFGVSYYNLPPEIAKLRKFCQLGYFHVDLPQWEEELENNRKTFRASFKKYLDFLNERINFSEEFLEYAYTEYCRFIDSLLEFSGSWLVASFPDITWTSFTTIEEIKKLTKEYNILEKARLSNIASQYRMMKESVEEKDIETDAVVHSK